MSVWAQMLTKQPRSTLHGQDHVHERPDMLLYLYSKYIHAVIFLPLIFLSWTSVILSVCSVSGPHSMRRRVWSNPSLYHAQHAKCACSCLFSITRNMHFLPPLWNFDGIGSPWLHMLSMLISLCYSTTVCASYTIA